MEINKLLEAIEEKDLSIKDLNIKDIIPNVIDEIIINFDEDNKIVLFLPIGITGDKMKSWMKGKGGVLFKDLNKNNKNEAHGKYVLLKNSDSKFIARLIEEEELDVFNHLKLIDGKIKDKAFMKLRNIKGEKITESNRYIEQQIYEEEMSPEIIITNHISSNDEDSVNHENTKSISLFED